MTDNHADHQPKSTLRTYFAMLVHVSRWHLVGVIAVTVLFSLSEGIGIALLLPTLQVAGFNMAGQGEAGRYAAMLSNAFACDRTASDADSTARRIRDAGRRAHGARTDPERGDVRGAAGSRASPAPPPLPLDRRCELAVRMPQPRDGFHSRADP